MLAYIKQVWNSIPDRKTLAGLSGLVTVLGAIVAVMVWLFAPFKGPDVVVQIIPQANTVPADLLQANKEVAKASSDFVNSLDRSSRDRNIRRVQNKLKLPVMQRFLAQTSLPPLDKLHVIIRNVSGHDISNVRLQVTGVSTIWSCSAGGKFVSTAEAKSYNEQLLELRDKDTLSAYEGFNLPPLPTLTAGGVFDIQFTGHLADVKVVPTQGVPCIVQTPSKDWMGDDMPNVATAKFLLRTFGPFVLSLVVLLCIWRAQKRRADQRSEMYGLHSQQLAAEAMLQQKPELAVWLLQRASLQRGFDAARIKNDPSFLALHNHAEFKKLTSDSTPILLFGTP